jgi:hypothetical protein
VSHTSSNGKELLLGLIDLHAFDFKKGNAPRCASRSSRLQGEALSLQLIPTYCSPPVNP